MFAAGLFVDSDLCLGTMVFRLNDGKTGCWTTLETGLCWGVDSVETIVCSVDHVTTGVCWVLLCMLVLVVIGVVVKEHMGA